MVNFTIGTKNRQSGQNWNNKNFIMKLNVKDRIELLTTEEGFSWGINSVMQILRPNCLYQIQPAGGEFKITKWYDNQWSDETQSYIEPPTSQEIRDEYIRQQTIAECLEYFEKVDK